MGLINPDVFIFNNGVEKANTYVSFANETLYIRQGQASSGGMMMPGGPGMSVGTGERLYRVNANYSIYWDKPARFAGKPYIQQGYVTTTFDDPTPVNVYECLYDVLKQTVFPNAYDSVANDPNAKAAEEPVAEPAEESAEESAEEPVAEPVAEESAEEPVVAEESAEEPVVAEEPAPEESAPEESAEEPVPEETAEEPVAEPVAESAEEPVAEPAEEPVATV